MGGGLRIYICTCICICTYICICVLVFEVVGYGSGAGSVLAGHTDGIFPNKSSNAENWPPSCTLYVSTILTKGKGDLCFKRNE